MNEQITNNFYTGNSNKFGFGNYESGIIDYRKMLAGYDYPSLQNNTINKYFSSNPTSKSLSLPSIYNTNASLPTDFTNSNAQPLKTLNPHQFQGFDNYGFMHSQPRQVPHMNFNPPLIEQQMLEEKARRLEYKNRLDLERARMMLVDRYIGNGRFREFLDRNKDWIMYNKIQQDMNMSMNPYMNGYYYGNNNMNGNQMLPNINEHHHHHHKHKCKSKKAKKKKKKERKESTSKEKEKEKEKENEKEKEKEYTHKKLDSLLKQGTTMLNFQNLPTQTIFENPSQQPRKPTRMPTLRSIIVNELNQQNNTLTSNKFAAVTKDNILASSPRKKKQKFLRANPIYDELIRQNNLLETKSKKNEELGNFYENNPQNYKLLNNKDYLFEVMRLICDNSGRPQLAVAYKNIIDEQKGREWDPYIQLEKKEKEALEEKIRLEAEKIMEDKMQEYNDYRDLEKQKEDDLVFEKEEEEEEIETRKIARKMNYIRIHKLPDFHYVKKEDQKIKDGYKAGDGISDDNSYHESNRNDLHKSTIKTENKDKGNRQNEKELSLRTISTFS